MTEHLKDGYERFREKYYQEHESLFHELAVGQHPKTAIIACSDSRVIPNILFDRPPGDFFVIRNVANLVPPYETSGNYHGTSAALDFAVNGLRVEQIVVLGHAQCGGIRALMENVPSLEQGGFIARWMQIAAAARDEVLARDDLETSEDRQHACEQTAIVHSLRNLLTFPWIISNIEYGHLRLAGCFFDLRTIDLSIVAEINRDSLSEWR